MQASLLGRNRSLVLASLQLTRAHNALSAFGIVVSGAYLSGRLTTGRPLRLALVGGLVAFLVTAGANALNDYYDIEIDRVNKPGRPLPSGRLSPDTANLLGRLLLSVALALASGLGVRAFLVALLLAGTACLYVAFLKRTLVANVTVGLLCAAGLVYGGALLGAPEGTFLSCIMVFLFIMSREILKSVEDQRGDAQAGVHSLATTFGRAWALRCYAFATLLAIVATFIPFIAGQNSWQYLVMMCLGVDAILVITLVWVLSRPTGRTIRRSLSFTKASFFFGLLAMCLP